MTTTLQHINHYNPMADSRVFGFVVGLALPALLFSRFMPPMVPVATCLGLLLIISLRYLAGDRVLGDPVIDVALVVLLLLLPLGLSVSRDPGVTLPRTYAFVAHAAIFWAVAAQRHTPWLRYSGWTLLLGSVVLGIALLLGTNFGSAKLPFIDREIYSLLPGGWRPFWNPLGFNSNLTGGLLVLFLAPALALVWGGSSWQQRDVAKPVAIVLALIILLSQSRGALMGGGVALLGMSLLHDRRWGILWGVVGLGIAAAVYRYGFNPLLESLLGRSDLFGDKSLTGRQQLWQQAVFIINQFPLSGVGFGMFEPTVRQLQSAPETLVQSSQEFKHAHNLYLHAGVEMGLLGLVAHLVIYLRLAYLLWQRARDRTAGYYRILALGLLGSMFALLTHGFFEVITYGPRPAAVVWALFGLMAAVAAGPVSSNEPSERPLPAS